MPLSRGKGSAPTSQVSSKQEIESQGNKHLLHVRWLGQRLQAQLKMVILKGAPGKAQQELRAGILNSGSYVNVQNLGGSRIVK